MNKMLEEIEQVPDAEKLLVMSLGVILPRIRKMDSSSVDTLVSLMKRHREAESDAPFLAILAILMAAGT